MNNNIIISLEKKHIEAIVNRTKKTESRNWIPQYWDVQKMDPYTARRIFPATMYVVIKGTRGISYILKVDKPFVENNEYKYPIRHVAKVKIYSCVPSKAHISPPRRFSYWHKLNLHTRFLIESHSNEEWIF